MTLFSVYILKCSDDTLYIGSTNNIEKRLHEHNNLKSGAHYTKIRRPATLVYEENCESLSLARKRECELKKLSRKEKLELIENSKNNSLLKI
ncbi:MAG: excinuclease ABC subunit C protein [uncultured bacterium (gcode 4)]|uniref:Excinuclease ABC subunit C protein n=1 Tax=uncultured bacterium (gcode 4) TaxID=1234023 RepID=K2FTS6_9BACT|nr:MAG: excinuclease ABC subunit C protein [uncultured bacterium (gcode 4)]